MEATGIWLDDASRFLRSGYQWPYLAAHGAVGLALGFGLQPLARGTREKQLLAIALFALAVLFVDLLIGWGLAAAWRFADLAPYFQFITRNGRYMANFASAIAVSIATGLSWWAVLQRFRVGPQSNLPRADRP
jgi:hypothetical protein